MAIARGRKVLMMMLPLVPVPWFSSQLMPVKVLLLLLLLRLHGVRLRKMRLAQLILSVRLPWMLLLRLLQLLLRLPSYPSLLGVVPSERLLSLRQLCGAKGGA